MSVIRLDLTLIRVCCAFVFARSIRARFSPRDTTRTLTADPRMPDSHASSSSLREGSTGTSTSRGTGDIGERRSSRPVSSCLLRLFLVTCAREIASFAVTCWLGARASLLRETAIETLSCLRLSSARSEYTCGIRSETNWLSSTSSTRSTLQLRSPRIVHALTKKQWTLASSSSEASPKISASTLSSRTTEFCSSTEDKAVI